MPFKQTHELLASVRAFRQRLVETFEAQRNQSDQRTHLVLDYLAAQQKRLQQSLSTYEQGASSSVLDAWFQYPNDEALSAPLEALHRPQLRLQDAVDVALQMSQRLDELYEHVAHRATSDQTRELFQRLWEMEHAERLNLMRQLNELEGM